VRCGDLAGAGAGVLAVLSAISGCGVQKGESEFRRQERFCRGERWPVSGQHVKNYMHFTPVELLKVKDLIAR